MSVVCLTMDKLFIDAAEIDFNIAAIYLFIIILSEEHYKYIFGMFYLPTSLSSLVGCARVLNLIISVWGK